MAEDPKPPVKKRRMRRVWMFLLAIEALAKMVTRA